MRRSRRRPSLSPLWACGPGTPPPYFGGATTGGVVEKTLSIHQSNVAIYNPATGKADRVGIKLLSDAEKQSRKTKDNGVRVYKSSGDEIKA